MCLLRNEGKRTTLTHKIIDFPYRFVQVVFSLHNFPEKWKRMKRKKSKRKTQHYNKARQMFIKFS